MKAVVVLDQGVTIGGQKYGHAMVVDSDKLIADPIWDKDDEKRKAQEDALKVKRKAASDAFVKLQADGSVVPGDSFEGLQAAKKPSAVKGGE